MPTVKVIYGFKRRYNFAAFAVGLPLMAITGAAVHRAWMRGVWDAWTWAGLAVFAVGSAAWIVCHYRLFTRMRCPDCGQMIVRPLPAAGDPLNFFCRPCNVEWVTGLQAPQGD